MRKGRAPKTSGTCEYPGCAEPALAVGSHFSITTKFFKVRTQLISAARHLCLGHLTLAMHQGRMPELGRCPGDGIKFPRKALCEHLKQSVSADDCFRCFDSAAHPKGFNHMGCQDAHLEPSPWEKLIEKAEATREEP